jgi:Zincin-like metallopeptidase
VLRQAGAPLSWTKARAASLREQSGFSIGAGCERARKAAATERQPPRAERALASGAIKHDYSAHVSSHRRDRHGRGLRGPLALPNALSVRRAQPPHPANKADFFSEAVHDAVDRVGLQCPEALVGITFGIEDVPHFDMAWSGDQVPLAAAVEGTANQPGQVVVYRRPLEHRAVSRRGLRILVYRTIVEQLSALTGRSVEEIDPDGAGAEDD